MPLFGGRPTVVGHRGGGAGDVRGLRENSLGSLSAAAGAGAPWLELDVHRCADGLALTHDPAPWPAGPVIGRTVEQLRADGVDDLAAALAALPAAVGVDIDVKTSLEDAVAGPATASVLAPLVERELARRPLLVTSFDPAVLLELRALVPAAPLGLLTWVGFPARIAVASAARLGVDVVGLHVGSLGTTDGAGGYDLWPDAPDVIGAAHAAGLEVLAWCPDPAAAAVLAATGVDAVVVDDVHSWRAGGGPGQLLPL